LRQLAHAANRLGSDATHKKHLLQLVHVQLYQSLRPCQM
jgi:hypothetical protein